MQFSALLIGQDNLLIQCAQMLLERKHDIRWVITPVENIQAWCEKNKITWLSSMNELPENNTGIVDYLFSIVNGKILKKNELKVARIASINYHDALLPKYAGVNATTWSILNDEKIHGITWHCIDEGIDTGNIVYQEQFQMTESETALTMNLRCFEEATKGFAEIIQKIETGEFRVHQQSEDERSYYGVNHLLPDLGFINWENATEQSINKLYRALSFGNYSNKVGSIKLYLENEFLIVGEVASVTHTTQQPLSGSIQAITDEGILVNTNTQPIWLKQLTSVSGKKIHKADLTENYKLKVGEQLPQLSGIFIKNNVLKYQQALANEKYWLTKLPQIAEHSTYNSRLVNFNAELEKIATISAGAQRGTPSYNTHLIAAVLIYLYRINNYENFTAYYMNDKTADPTLQDAKLFAHALPLSMDNHQSDCSLQTFVSQVKNQIETLDKRGCYLNDIFLRYPQLQSNLSENNDYVITIALTKNKNSRPQNSIIHFEIDEEKNEITIHHRINTNFQGGSISTILNNLQEHLINILNVIFESPNTGINQFSFLGEKEKAQLFDWSIGEHRPLPSNTFTSLFERQIQFAPDSAAIYDHDNCISYQKLWQNAEKYAAFLATLNLQPNSRIGIAARTLSQLMAITLGTLKAGHICQPIDCQGKTLSDDQDYKFLITSIKYLTLLKKKNLKHYIAEDIIDTTSKSSTAPPIQLDYSIPKQDCLYLTATNKLLNQKQVINYCYWFADNCNINNQSVFIISLELAVETKVMQALSVLLMGGTLDSSISQHQKISHLSLATTGWENLTTNQTPTSQINSVQYVVLTDEIDHSDKIKRWNTLYPNSKYLVVSLPLAA